MLVLLNSKGGIVEGPSHSEGGVRGTGRFNNIEVEGGEIVIPKVATANNIELLENIRKQGHVKKFNQGGFYPLKMQLQQVQMLILEIRLIIN